MWQSKAGLRREEEGGAVDTKTSLLDPVDPMGCWGGYYSGLSWVYIVSKNYVSMEEEEKGRGRKRRKRRGEGGREGREGEREEEREEKGRGRKRGKRRRKGGKNERKDVITKTVSEYHLEGLCVLRVEPLLSKSKRDEEEEGAEATSSCGQLLFFLLLNTITTLLISKVCHA